MIWIATTVVLIIAFFVNYYFISEEIITLIIPLTLGILPFFREWWNKRKESKAREIKINQEIKKIKDYLKTHFSCDLISPEIKEFEDEDDIYSQFIKTKFSRLDNIEVNSVLLCFFCDLWDRNNSPKEYEKIQKYSYSIGLSFAEISDKTKIFLKIFSALNSDKKYESFEEIRKSEVDYHQFLKDFSKKYIKDLSFFEIKYKLNQSENLRQTLIRLIKEGELSNWGITNETLEKLENDLKKEIDYSKTFLVIGNKLSDEVKEYLKSQPGLTGWRPRTRNTSKQGLYSAFVIKPRGAFSDSMKLLNKLKVMSKDKEEVVLFVVPLDFLKYESYTLPSNQSFSTQNLKESYEAINWFRTGYGYSDTDVWNAITKSNITLDELWSIIPFNVFCKGILPCEQTFMIKNYKMMKQKCGVKNLTDWKDKEPDLIVEYLLEFGVPDYNKIEKEQVLKLKDRKFDEAVRSRLKELASQIVKSSGEVNESLIFLFT